MKTKPLYYRFIEFLLWVILAFMVVGGVLYEVYRNPRLHLFGDLVYRVEPDQKVVALTFSDGPKPGTTQELLSVLNREGVLGTFYLNGLPMEANPEETKLIIKKGHEVGSQGYSHFNMGEMSYEEIAEEIESTEKVIRELGYKGELTFRPPFGKGLFTLPSYLKDNGITNVTWDVEAETFIDEEDTTEKIVARTLEQVKPGSIILMHIMYEEHGQSMAALPIIIRKLKEQGYSFATVSELIKLGVE